MNLQQCLKILELENIGTFQEAKRAYKDLVRVWHPDRFQGNPRLKQKADEKLREINLAFTFLSDYLASRPSGETTAPGTTSRSATSGSITASYAAPSASQKPETNNHTIAQPHVSQRVGTAVPMSKTAPRTTSIGRYVLIAFFLVVVFIAALAIYFLSNTDKIASKTRGIASEAMENIVNKLEQNQTIQKNDPAVKRLIQNLDQKTSKAESEKLFEIHLDSSSIIMTEMWWEEGDMIMYKVDGGSMGIERSRVKKIVKR